MLGAGRPLAGVGVMVTGLRVSDFKVWGFSL